MTNRLLIIGGQPYLREKLTSLLNEAGFTVAHVPDYPEALAKLDELNPDIAIVDEVLPGGDGKDACSGLRNALGIPVLLLGNDSGAEAWERAVEAGADFYFTGLVRQNELAARVKAILRRYKSASVLRLSAS